MYPNPNRKKFTIIIIALAIAGSLLALILSVSDQSSSDAMDTYENSSFSILKPKNSNISREGLNTIVNVPMGDGQQESITISRYVEASPDITPDKFYDLITQKTSGSSNSSVKADKLTIDNKRAIHVINGGEPAEVYVFGDRYVWRITVSGLQGGEVSKNAMNIFKSFKLKSGDS